MKGQVGVKRPFAYKLLANKKAATNFYVATASLSGEPCGTKLEPLFSGFKALDRDYGVKI